MPSKQVLHIRVLTCAGLSDLMSYSEATFLVNALALFRNVEDRGRAVPRANADLIRAYTQADFLRGITSEADILHLVAHASRDALQTGNGKSEVTPALLKKKRPEMPGIVISTACRFDSSEWKDALGECGVTLLIAADSNVTPANLSAFDMSFYAALLSCVRRGIDTEQRVAESFELADRYYRSIHATGSPHAKFRLTKL